MSKCRSKRFSAAHFFSIAQRAARLASWRSKAQERATQEAGYAYAAYGHIKLSGMVEEIVDLCARRLRQSFTVVRFDTFRQAMWAEVRDARN